MALKEGFFHTGGYLVKTYDKLFWKTAPYAKELCSRAFLLRLVEVNIEIVGDTVTESRTKVRVTMSDTIAKIGKETLQNQGNVKNEIILNNRWRHWTFHRC